MIKIELIKKYFPPYIQENAIYNKYIIKEYIQLLILDFISTTIYTRKLTFIGGTNLRLVKGIDRFSEDLDFDCKNLSKEEFIEMTNNVLLFLKRNGFNVFAKEKEKDKLNALHRSIHFPELLFDLELSGHKDERFMIKLESQDQQVMYNPVFVNIKGCGFFFPFPVPPDEILCAMKISAMLSRHKGRDFYDVIFLLAQSYPDYLFLSKKTGINNLLELKEAIEKLLNSVDLKLKMKDFEHLLFNKEKSSQIPRIREFIGSL
jgi:predicted nucleotidyltransferase component of viral defense system